ncbi:MAG: hypothetical protein HRU12_01315, partial [Phaeodactylibacter sp.]|nr:hypothetical protein [Phaeodactylibacter sp.]
MQELIKLRLNDENKAALLDLDLKRLQFAYQKLIYAGKEERYETALLSIIEAYKDTPEVLQARHKLAQHYQKLGQSYSPFGDTTYRWKLKTALRLINESDTTDKESYWSGSLKELKRQLLSQSINIQAEQVCLPGQPLLFSVSYRNVPQLHYKLVPLSPQEAYELEGNRNSETMKALINRNSRLSGIISLPDEGDLQQHRTEFPIDAQDFGSYVFLYSTNSAFDASADVGAVFFTVSELGALYQRNANQLLVAHRAQGQPLQGVTVAYFTTRYNRRERKQELVAHSTEQTDAMGLAELPKNSQKYYVVRLSRGADVQFINNGFSRNNSYEQDASRSVTHFFLDRSIYRPGQTVYFKALTLNYDKNGLPAVLPEQDVTISFRDANRQEVATIELQTNEYGTVQGTFIAPRGGLLGQMSLLSSVGGNSHFFSVEEYKRPKFEVKIEPLTGQQELNDTVTITGIAKAYAGNIIDGAKVAYRVQRSTSYPWSPWWYRMPQSNAMEIANGTSTTMSDGSFNIQFLALPDETVSPENRPEFTYTITV